MRQWSYEVRGSRGFVGRMGSECVLCGDVLGDGWGLVLWRMHVDVDVDVLLAGGEGW